MIDLAGQRFGPLFVLDRAEDDASGNVRWRCRCDCGGEAAAVRTCRLRAGTTRSCGCRRGKSGPKPKDLTGRRFGSWTVKGPCRHRTRNGGRFWLCDCYCGRRGVVETSNLNLGRSTRCTHCKGEIDGRLLAEKRSRRRTPSSRTVASQPGAAPAERDGADRPEAPGEIPSLSRHMGDAS